MLAFSRRFAHIGISRNRHVHTSIPVLSTEKSPLFLLRKKTGLAYSLCREALNKHQDNVEEAEAWLKAHAMAHGLQKASKVRDRNTREGLVCLSVPTDNSLITVIELNCETDFVAKNQLFRDFALDISNQIASSVHDSTSYNSPDQDIISSLKPNQSVISDIERQIVPLITKLGENIKLSRALHLKPTNPRDPIKLFGQIHAQIGKASTDQNETMVGRFGAIVGLQLAKEARSADLGSIRSLGNRLCQHVIGYNPTYIELPSNIRKHLEEIEKERQQSNSGDREEELDESLSDNEGSRTTKNDRDEWPSIMDQTLIMTDDLSVRNICESNHVSIVYFNRLECGMESW